jgi:hypothetical protein
MSSVMDSQRATNSYFDAPAQRAETHFKPRQQDDDAKRIY